MSWPFDRLTITTPALVLRPVRDGDLPAFVGIFPDDFDTDPAYPPLPGLGADADRQRRFRQSVWRHRGCWSVADWALDFGVWRDGEPLGIQTLEGSEFPRSRTVDSASWIAKPFRGNGFGVRARAAVLSFAFNELGAHTAITSAVTTNSASLGVSRHLGYRDNGTSKHDTGRAVVDLQHLILRRDEWLASGLAPVEVSGFAECRPYFGLA